MRSDMMRRTGTSIVDFDDSLSAGDLRELAKRPDLLLLQCSAPALEEFRLVDGRQQTPQMLLPVLNNPRVRAVEAYFGSEGKNDEFTRPRQAHGKAGLDAGKRFEYR